MFGRPCKTRTIFTYQYSFYTADSALYKQTSLAIISHPAPLLTPDRPRLDRLPNVTVTLTILL